MSACSFCIEAKSLAHCFECENKHLIPGLHGGNQDGKQRIAEEELMHGRHLATAGVVFKHASNPTYHPVNILSLLEKTHFLRKGYLADDIEGIELQPFAQVYGIAFVDKVTKAGHQ